MHPLKVSKVFIFFQMMRAQQSINIIRGLLKCKKHAPDIIRNLDVRGIDALCEAIYNICYSQHLSFKSHTKSKLRKLLNSQRKEINKICKKSVSAVRRKNLLCQIPALEILKLGLVAIPCIHESKEQGNDKH